MNFAEHTLKPRSEKIILATVEGVKEYKLFTLFTGAVYSRDVDYFVSGVAVDGSAMTHGVSTALLVNQYYFDAKNKKLYVRLLDDSHPKTKQLSVTHKFFYSNGSVYVPHDLASGEVVEFEGRIASIGSLGQSLDDQNTGIVLESSSSMTLFNNDGYFDEIFDTLIWENQNVNFYSWSPSLPVSEAQRIFTGVIESKDFSPSAVVFKVKDFVFKLKNLVTLPVFSSTDGEIAPSMSGKPKRRIYGKVKQIKCTPVDCTLGGYALTGTISATIDSQALTGAGTLFLDELSPGDEVLITVLNQTVKFGIQSIESDTTATLGSKSSVNVNNISAICSPDIPWRKKNRTWSIAGHKLRAPATTITQIVDVNRIVVGSVNDLFVDDSIKINGEYVFIRRISGNQIVLNSALAPLPIVGDAVSKNAVSRAYFGPRELFIDRDWTLSNTAEAILTLDPLAEFNQTEQKSAGASFLFTNGSRLLTTSLAVDLRSILKPRDWIRKDSVTETTWYEILDVKEQSVYIRTAFTGTTETTSALIKNVEYISDDSLITVDCMGLESAGAWVKTPSDVVKHLLLNDSGFTAVDETSFAKANSSCGYIVSMAIPEQPGGSIPQIKNVITSINDSVFGSLYGNSSMNVCYSILNSTKPEAIETLRDDDIISFDVSSDQKIINGIKVNYRPQIDIFTGEESFDVYSEESTFVNRLIGIKNTEQRTLYLYEEDKAKIMAQRILFGRAMSTCKVSIKGKLNLATKSVNDKLYLELDRLYRRYGGRDRKKVGTITSVKKNGTDVDIDIIDLGNLFNRVPAICPNNIPVYASSTREQSALWGWVVDNEILSPNVLSELDLGNNLIG